MKFHMRDVEFEAFSGSGPGGQYRNRHANCIRAIHRPTGVTAQATSERSQTQNKAAAVKLLLGKLARMADRRTAAEARRRYDSQPDAAFGHAIRTVRMVGEDQGVKDLRTGATITLEQFRRGQIDELLIAGLRGGV